jgi:hypothetical protein
MHHLNHFSTITLIIIMFSCNSSNDKTNDYSDDFPGPKYHFSIQKTPRTPDYSISNTWMFLPENPGQFDVDLLWFYPTTFVSDSLWNMPLDDVSAKMGAKNDFIAMAGVFEEYCNIYAPYYRQACLAVLSASESDFNAAFNLAYTDAEKAVEYYFEQYNNNRKFVIAGHSQGANHVLELLKNNDILNENLHNMIAAYVVGWSVTISDTINHPQLNICDSATEQGCIITYNTIEDGFQDEASHLTLLPNSITVNPLLWNTSEEFAPKELHKGAVFKTDEGYDTIYHYTSAQNINGLCVERPSNVDNFLVFEPYFYPGIYHVYDYEFFHLNLKSNLHERIKAAKQIQ